MLKRSEIIALSKAALQRVASRKAGGIPANKKHVERLDELKRDKKDREAAEAAYQDLKRA
jgi:hypothetical protein